MSLRVLHCIPFLSPSYGGPARSVPALAEAEAQAGADVRVWCPRPTTIDTSEYPNTTFVSGSVRQLRDEGWHPDIVHHQGLWRGCHHQAARLARRLNIPRIISPRGMLEPWCLNHHRFRKKIAWALYQHRDLKTAACLHATSVSEAEQFRRLGFQQAVALLPNGVDFPDDACNETGGYEHREILFLSRIHPVKGLLNLVAAWKDCVRPGWKLRIVGDDEFDHREQVKAAVRTEELNESVSVEPAVHSAEKWTLMKNADIVILPSMSENFGIVVAEALAVGTPVITTTGTPWSEVVTHDCGWYVEPSAAGVSEALATAMTRSRSELHEMGARGREWVTREFAWDDVGHRMLQTYRWMQGQAEMGEWFHADARQEVESK